MPLFSLHCFDTVGWKLGKASEPFQKSSVVYMEVFRIPWGMLIYDALSYSIAVIHT